MLKERPELLRGTGILEPGGDTFRDGFSIKTLWGALFVGLVMMPGSIYLSLVVGHTLGPAAEWVTIILFTEVARRSFTVLRKQEVYILFYVAAALASGAIRIGGQEVGGGPFTPLIWNQYLVQSPETEAISGEIPDWVAPPRESPAIKERNLFDRAWVKAIVLILIFQVIGRLNWIGMGFTLFRITRDIERLPFPLAPIAAEGATALAESTTKEESWRWTVFSTGAMLGILFGSIYVLIPAVSGLIMKEPIMLLPIPFKDYTASTESFLPAALIGLGFDFNALIIGMILPFSLVMGMAIGTVSTSVLGNPILYHLGMFPNYTRGRRLLHTKMLTDFDFWLSVGVGLAFSIALIGIVKVIIALATKRQTGIVESEEVTPEYRKQRGDFPIWLAIGLFVFSTTASIVVCRILVPEFPILIIVFFGFIWTPLNSYISARMIGITGMGLSFPYLREVSFILSGYPGVDIWFAPIPLGDFGAFAQRFREIELTRTRFTSIIKAEILIVIISLVCSFIFWAFFWKITAIPSAQYPYTAAMWPVHARFSYLVFTANSGQNDLFLRAFKPPLIAGGLVVGLAIYGLLSKFGLPLTFFYGLVAGTGNFPHGVLPLFLGALLGRYVFQKRFGKEKWQRYLPVIAAGFACGMGLVGMISVALALITKAAQHLPV